MILPNTVCLSFEDAAHFLANLAEKEPTALASVSAVNIRYLIERAYNKPYAYEIPSSNVLEEAQKLLETMNVKFN